MRAKELKRELKIKYYEEYLIYLTEKVSVRRSMDTGGLCDSDSVCSQDCLVLCNWRE